MTIFELGAFGEFFGVILLFASLIFIGLEYKKDKDPFPTKLGRSFNAVPI